MIQMIADVARPPAHHPTSAHAAVAGTNNSAVSSMGSIARTCGIAGSRKKRNSARISFFHPGCVASCGTSGAAVGSLTGRSACVAAHVRDDREVARALDGGRELPLMSRAHAAHPARQDLAVVGDETAERAVVLVI